MQQALLSGGSALVNASIKKVRTKCMPYGAVAVLCRSYLTRADIRARHKWDGQREQEKDWLV